MSKVNRGTIWFDKSRQSWRVRVFVDGQPVFRRAHSHAEALQVRQQLLLQKDRAAYDRLRAGESLLDVSGLTDEQLAVILMLITSWGYPDPDEVPLIEAALADQPGRAGFPWLEPDGE